MGEARRRSAKGSIPRENKKKVADSSQLSKWLPITERQRDQFFSITKTGAWIGIFVLILFWVVVRFIGPAAGWWVLSDM